jgi:hypothetical protein
VWPHTVPGEINTIAECTTQIELVLQVPCTVRTEDVPKERRGLASTCTHSHYRPSTQKCSKSPTAAAPLAKVERPPSRVYCTILWVHVVVRHAIGCESLLSPSIS